MRITFGLLAVVSIAGGVVAWQLDDGTLAGILIRVGVILGALWFGWPSLIAVDRRRLWIAVPVGAVVVLRPRSALVVIPVAVWFLAQQRRGGADR